MTVETDFDRAVAFVRGVLVDILGQEVSQEKIESAARKLVAQMNAVKPHAVAEQAEKATTQIAAGDYEVDPFNA